MKKNYTKYLGEALQECLAKVLPNFEPFTLRLGKTARKNSTLMPGEIFFVWKVRADFWVFLSFIPSRTQERFTVDIGWSNKQQFPWSVPRPTVYSLEPDKREMCLEECMIDFNDLLKQATGSGVFFGWDVWTCSVDSTHPEYMKIFVQEDLQPVADNEASSRVRAAAKKSIDDIISYAMPYVHSLIEKKSA